ncbi:MAG: HAD family hydrolase [Lentisphaerae bacterium]|nr:HAD family hydrolase [Lentisphaerota bacterium]
MYKACFLDRDGVLIEEEDYLCDPARVRLCSGAVEAIKLAHSVGRKVFLISNQAGLAKGKFKMEDLKAVHAKVEELLAEQGVALDGYYYCPHHAKGIVPEYTRECSCRKPGPGMILKAAEEHDLDVKNSFMIGDRLTDLEAGVNAGCSAVALVRTGYGETQELPEYPGVTVIDAKNIGEAVAALVRRMD